MAHRIYDHLLDPRENPDYARRAVQPPHWGTFGGRTRLIYITDFSMDGNRVVSIDEALDMVKRYGLGDVYKVSYPVIYAENVQDLADAFRERDLFLFSLYGYVPGSGPGGLWRQYIAPPEVLRGFEERLGDHWLGMENGEQDGRYVGGFAAQMVPRGASRVEQYLNFQRHFEKHGDDVGNRMTILVSLNFGHYFAKEGVYSVNGAETGQALPNGQVYYSFIRGAGEQYGLPWIGNASVFNRWGWKWYGKLPSDWAGVEGNVGPAKGSSLSLLKRLLYSHILYNSVAVGLDLFFFENDAVSRAWEHPGNLSPIGKIQQAAGQWMAREGQPGTMLRPVALLLDFFCGWSFPRHLYTRDVYRVWGNLPYEPGDHLTDGVLDMLYPGYQDSSYYHDESGFISATPFGDAADCILSDAEPWLLERYPLLVVAGALSGGQEIRDKLQTYVEGGGHLAITAGSLARLPGGIAGVTASRTTSTVAAGARIQLGSRTITEGAAFSLAEISLSAGAEVVARCGDHAAVVRLRAGRGTLTVLASPFGVPDAPAAAAPLKSEEDRKLPRPFPLLAHVEAVLAESFREQMLFEVDPGLSLITCRRKPGEYVLGICNNSLAPRSLAITSRCGTVLSLRETAIDQSEKTAVGYMPEGFEKASLGVSGPATIAGGDVRVFVATVHEQGVESISHRAPPPRPRGRVLGVRGTRSVKEEILLRPTFFEHFDGIMVDWKVLAHCERAALEHESGWLDRQKARAYVDLSSGLNLYPDLRLVNNITEEHERSMRAVADVLAKMPLVRSRDLVLCLHRLIENNITEKDAWESMDATVRRICTDAAAAGIRVHLRLAPGKPPRDLAEATGFLTRVGAPNLDLAPSVGDLLARGVDAAAARREIGGRVGLWLAGAPQTDLGGETWTVQAPLASGCDERRLRELLAVAPEAPVVLDAVYESQDDEYRDAVVLGRVR
jgi:hypothetical protein